MIYKKQSRRRHFTKNKKGGGSELKKSSLENGTPFWYWSGDPNIVTTAVTNWIQSSLSDGTPFWYDADNSSNPTAFVNPYEIGNSAVVTPPVKINWIQSSLLSDGTPFWYDADNSSNPISLINPYEIGNPAVVTPPVKINWIKKTLADGTVYWFDENNGQNITFENPFEIGNPVVANPSAVNPSVANPMVATLPQDDNPPVVVITGKSESYFDDETHDIGGVYHRTDEILNGYPVYTHHVNKTYCIVYSINENGKFWQIIFRSDDYTTVLAFTQGECGELFKCKSNVWSTLIENEIELPPGEWKRPELWAQQPEMKMLVGSDAEPYIADYLNKIAAMKLRAPSVVAIIGDTQLGPNQNNYNFGGIYDRSDKIVNDYPIYLKRDDDNACIMYRTDDGSPFFEIRHRNEPLSSRFYNYMRVPNEFVGLDDTSTKWYHGLNYEPIQMLIGEDVEEYIKNPNPPIVIITGKSQTIDANGVKIDIGGIYERTDEILNGYPIYRHSSNQIYSIIFVKDDDGEYWQIVDSNNVMLAFITDGCGGLDTCTKMVWNTRVTSDGDNQWEEQPKLKMLIGCAKNTQRQLNVNCDFEKSRLNGGRRSVTKQIRKRSATKQIRKRSVTKQIRKRSVTKQIRKRSVTKQIRKRSVTKQIRKRRQSRK